MNQGPAASLDSSMLARKGDAAPAISDESPLVLHLDDHRPELSHAPKLASDDGGASIGDGGHSRKVSLLSSGNSSRVWWIVALVTALILVAVLWLSVGSKNSLPTRSEVLPETTTATVAVAESDVLKINPTPEPAPPEAPAVAPELPATSAALPASAAFAASETASETATDESATTFLATPDKVVTTQGTPIIPVNIPPVEPEPEVGGVDAIPEIPSTLPKSVSPIPIPKSKPEVTTLPADSRYAVQLASIAVEKRANEEAFRLQKQLGHILGEHAIEVEKAVVDGRGTMYRLRAGGFKTQAEANSACAQLAQLKIDCLALRR